MPRNKRPARRRPETVVRFIIVTGVNVGIGISTAQEGGAEPALHSTGRIQVTGTMDEPVRDNRDVKITVYSADNPKPGSDPLPWVGLVHGVRPVLQAATFISHRDFDRVWSLALSGLLKHAYLMLSAPRYQSAYVLNVSFSTDPED
jgi:hypothetical protein